jgi:pyruvate/2-oxoglutarate dehydrogenase complex dihydrolipoamide dehydrogenase (E3) component
MSNLSSLETRVDLCVIGAGAGGLAVAAAAAQLGVSVALVEKHKMGGDCLNYGCVPSKALLAAARRAHLMRSSAAFGIRPVDPPIDAAAVCDHVQGVIAAIAPNDSVERFAGLGVKVIRANGHFITRDTLLAGDQRIKLGGASCRDRVT